MKKEMKKEIKKTVKKTHKSILICILLFLILGLGIGYSTVLVFSRNDTFEINGEKYITLGLNEQYTEHGAKAIAFGKNISDKIEIESNLDTTTKGEYTIIYTIKSSFKYKNIKRVRYVTVGSEGDNNE